MKLTRHITNTVRPTRDTGSSQRLQPGLAAAKTRFNIAGCADGPVMNSKNILEGYLIKTTKQSWWVTT